ncbi:MAG: DUF2155 domain-containing protein [Hyphomicrobiaceae bacterium]
MKSNLIKALLVGIAAVAAGPAQAQRIENKVAVFAALDKVTARISKLEAPLGETVKFGSLKLTTKVCYSRSATEQPKTSTFVEVDETMLSGQEKRLFAGWMFAESPGLHAVEHPVFDIWLTDCKQPVKPVPQAAAVKPGQVPATGGVIAPADGGEAPLEPRRRARR